MAFCSIIRTITSDSASSKYHIHYDNKTIETTVTTKATVTEQWINEILLAHAHDSMVVVGLDVEWRPHPMRFMSNKSATLQLCIDTKCLILQLFYMDEIPESLKAFLLNPDFTFVGIEVEDDILKLKNEYGLGSSKSADIRSEAIKKWPGRFRRPAWQALAGIQREDDYCNKFCGTKDAYCDSMHGKCICIAGITYASVAFGINRIPLSSQCHDDKICRKYWCRRADSYCDDGACICHPCRPRHF
ncbi:hypothetical protein R6Q57_015257 [Mikania cordata]